ncbi:MAG: hypothetical protein MR391_00005, partial [Dorea formicigenerans]|nr:hypothetical protein [Dorea formicigenerans]
HVASRKAGGYYSYSTSVLERIPLAIADNQQSFIELVDQIMDLTDKGQETDKLEQKIDEMVYELYGIDDEGKNLIEQDLSSY